MAIVTVGIDFAKTVFTVQGVDETGKPVLLRPGVPRTKPCRQSWRKFGLRVNVFRRFRWYDL
jgi:hypothetical protein